MPPSPSTAAGQYSPLVTVFGAAGFIGRFVVEELARHGWRVRAFIHASEADPLDGQLAAIVRGDIREADAVGRALAGASAAVNAAGLKSDEPESEAVNVGGTRNLIEAARAHGGTRIIHFSTQAVKIRQQGRYARTKLAADQLLERSGLPFTILRPSLVYGPGPSGVAATMQRFVERWPIVPVLGDGQWTSAPVHVQDVAQAVAACLGAHSTIGRTYDLGGPDLVSLDELLDRIAANCGRRGRKLHVPYPLALLAVRAAVWLLPRAPVSVSNVLGSNQPIPLDSAPAHHDFGFAPMSLDQGLRLLAAAAEASVLRSEAQRFARYLLHVEPPAELVRRYADAAHQLFDSVDGDTAYVRRHPWALPCVDAATALFRPGSQVRQRTLLMLALLETAPAFAEQFLSPPPDRLRLGLGLVRHGLSTGAKLLVGSLLLPFVPPTCRRIST